MSASVAGGGRFVEIEKGEELRLRLRRAWKDEREKVEGLEKADVDE